MKIHLNGKWMAFLAAAGLMVSGAGRAQAALIVSTPSFTATAGSTGTFSILLDNTGASSVSIGGFSFGISTTNPGITFSSANINTIAAPYIFGSDSLFGPDITISSGLSLTASDNPASVASYPVAAGATVSLGLVTYSISSGAASGLFDITLSSAATSLANADGGNIPIDTLSNGQINVQSAVPEPAGLGVFGGTVLLLASVAVRRRTPARL